MASALHRWAAWLSDDGGSVASSPALARIETGYRSVAASIGRHSTLADTVLAVALAACTLPQLLFFAGGPPGPFIVRMVFSALMVVPLIWRRRWPLFTFAFVAAVALGQWICNVTLAADVALLVYLYTVASRYPVRVASVATSVVEVGAVMSAVRWRLTSSSIETFLLLSGPVLASLLLGISVRDRRKSLAALTDRAEQLERERDQQAAIATAAERTRIAREMHDVVAHSLSVMVTLSDGAVLKQAVEPDRAITAMRQVSATGHQALDEMRRLLGVLRTEEPVESRQPQPGMAQIDGLVDQVRATGLTAELTVTGDHRALPPGAELTVYRIVQEALTNTLKHAVEPTRIVINICWGPDPVTVDVHDDGAGRPLWPDPSAAGHGLTGMRERAAVYGGAVTAGPDPAGGWRIHASVPMTSATTVGASHPSELSWR